jgi:hypothetical protein
MALKILQSIFVLFSGRRPDYSTPADNPKDQAAVQAARERNRLANERSLKMQAEAAKKKAASLPPAATSPAARAVPPVQPAETPT